MVKRNIIVIGENALKQSEERLRLLIESAKDYAIITLDADRKIVSWSVGAELMMGFSEQEIIGRSADIMFTNEDLKADAPRSEIDEAAKRGRAESERWHVRKNGNRFWGSGSISPLKDNDGSLIGFVKILRDLTETRRMEAARYFLASVVETSNDSVITIDFERTITSWNKAAEALYGYSASQAVGKSLDLLTLPEDFRVILDNIDKVQRNQQTAVFDTARVHKDGYLLELEIVMSPVFNASGELIGVSTIARDISKRKMREAQLGFLADLSRSLLENATTVHVETDVLPKVGSFYRSSICVFAEAPKIPSQTPIQLYWDRHRRKARPGETSTMFVDSDREMKELLANGEDIVIRNVQLDAGDGIKDHLQHFGICSLVVIPIMEAGSWRCSLGIYLEHSHDWSNVEIALLREIATRIWISIERAREQEDLRVSEIRFRTLTDAVPQVIWANDGKGVANYFNKRWFEYSGLSFEESFGKGWEAIVHPDDAWASRERWKEALHAGEIFDTEYRLRDKNGNYRWHIGRNVPVKNNSGDVIGWFGSATDIEDLKNTETLVRQTADRLQLALDAGDFGSYEYDMTTDRISGNPQHAQIFGYQVSEGFSFRQLKDIIVEEDREMMELELSRAIHEKRNYTIEYRINGKKERNRWIKSAGKIIFDENDQPVKMVGITLDITEQKLFTEELRRLVAEQTIELQRSNEDLRQFAHVASHDLKEPVRKVKTFNNRVQEEYGSMLPDRAKTYLAKIDSATNRMYTMIEGVLAYSKLGNLHQAFEPVDLHKIIQNIETDLEVMIAAKNASVSKGELPTITASEVLMYQLFYNLVLNSLKFAKPDEPAKITISCKAVDIDKRSFWQITVADNGIGINPTYASTIFNPFTRLNSGDEYEGTGLGLALCKKIVERHHGSIAVNSSPGKGASFLILFPVSR